MKIIAHIDMDAFFAAIEQRDNSSWRGKPVVVGADPMKGKGRGVVSACSYEARKFGIHSAMPITRAYELCPHAIYCPVDFKRYQQASHQFFDILYDFTPDIEPLSIDEAFLDITGSFHFFKTPVATCFKIKDRIHKELRLTASIGIAPNKMIAKIASALCKPDGLLEITEDKMLSFLWPLPIEKLWRVGAQTQKGLNKLGIYKIGDLAQCSCEELHQKFGENGQHLYDLANGIDERDVQIDDDVKSVSNEHTFDVDTGDKNEIYNILSVLSEKVSYRLRRQKLKGKTLTLKVRLKGFKTYTRSHTFVEKVNFFDNIYKTSKFLFNQFYEEDMKIRLVGVKMSNFKDMYVQESLFEDPGFAKQEKLHQAVDRIKNKFGEEIIRRGY